MEQVVKQIMGKSTSLNWAEAVVYFFRREVAQVFSSKVFEYDEFKKRYGEVAYKQYVTDKAVYHLLSLMRGENPGNGGNGDIREKIRACVDSFTRLLQTTYTRNTGFVLAEPSVLYERRLRTEDIMIVPFSSVGTLRSAYTALSAKTSI